MPYILSAHGTVDKIRSQAYGVPTCASTQLLNNSSVSWGPKHHESGTGHKTLPLEGMGLRRGHRAPGAAMI